MFWEKKAIKHDALTKELVCWQHCQQPQEVTQVIKKSQMSASLSKTWQTSLSKICYSAAFIKKVNVLWLFIKEEVGED